MKHRHQRKTITLALIAYCQMAAVVWLIASHADLVQAKEEKFTKDERIALPEMTALSSQQVIQAEENPDFAFWLRLSDRLLPVVQSRDNKEYLKLNLAKQTDKMGTLFIDRQYSPTSLNIVIYGHSASHNSERLTLLKKRPYVENNRIFAVENAQGTTKYQIIAYFNSTLPERDLAYLQTDFRNRSDFESFLKAANAKSIIDFSPPDFSQVDNSLTLVTCDMTTKGQGRWVVVAVPL